MLENSPRKDSISPALVNSAPPSHQETPKLPSDVFSFVERQLDGRLLKRRFKRHYKTLW